MTHVPRTVAAAVLRLHELGEADDWQKFAMLGRYNAFRLLKSRALVEEANDEARRAEFERIGYEACSVEDVADVWKRYPSRWRLTQKGRALVDELRARELR